MLRTRFMPVSESAIPPCARCVSEEIRDAGRNNMPKSTNSAVRRFTKKIEFPSHFFQLREAHIPPSPVTPPAEESHTPREPEKISARNPARITESIPPALLLGMPTSHRATGTTSPSMTNIANECESGNTENMRSVGGPPPPEANQVFAVCRSSPRLYP